VILQRVLMAIAAAAALSAAAVIAMVALAFAVYGFLEPHFGSADASAGVAALYAFLIGFGGFMAARGVTGPVRRRPKGDGEALGLTDRLMDLARDKPLAAIGVALAIGVILVRSPKSLAAIARAFFEAINTTAPERKR
jgi:hypothetical protein